MRMHEPLSPTSPATFQPALQVADAQASDRLAQVTLRLRREVCWLWRQHGMLARRRGQQRRIVAANCRPAGYTLDLVRFDSDKQIFFANDETALWLTRQPADASPRRRGRSAVAWRFHLGGGDSRSGARRTFRAGAGAGRCHRQRCWQRVRRLPERCLPHATNAGVGATAVGSTGHAIVALADPSHRLYRHGLPLAGSSHSGSSDWDAPLLMAPAIGRQLAFPEAVPFSKASLDAPDPTRRWSGSAAARRAGRPGAHPTALWRSPVTAAADSEPACRIAR